jgi:rubredoxin
MARWHSNHHTRLHNLDRKHSRCSNSYWTGLHYSAEQGWQRQQTSPGRRQQQIEKTWKSPECK